MIERKDWVPLFQHFQMLRFANWLKAVLATAIFAITKFHKADLAYCE